MSMLREDVVGIRFELENDPALILANEMRRVVSALAPFQQQLSQSLGSLFQNDSVGTFSAIQLPPLDLSGFQGSLTQANAMLHQFQSVGQVVLGLFRNELKESNFAIQRTFTVVSGVFFQMAQTMQTSLQNVQLATVGSQIMQGLLSGIMSQKDAIFSAVSGIAQGIKNTISSVMRIASPSKEMARLGRFIGLGLPDGFHDAMPEINKGVQQMHMAVSGVMDFPGTGSPTAQRQPLAPVLSKNSAVTQNYYTPQFTLKVERSGVANERELETKVRDWVRKSFEEVLAVGDTSVRWEV